MACKTCAERRKKLRDAIMHGKMAEAVGQSVAGLREMIGYKADEAGPEAPTEDAIAGPDETAPPKRNTKAA